MFLPFDKQYLFRNSFFTMFWREDYFLIANSGDDSYSYIRHKVRHMAMVG